MKKISLRRKSILSLLLLVSLILCISAVSASEFSDSNNTVSSVNTLSTDSNLLNTNSDLTDSGVSEVCNEESSSDDNLGTGSSNIVESTNPTISSGQCSVDENNIYTAEEPAVVKVSQANKFSSEDSTVVKSQSLTKTYFKATNKKMFNGQTYSVGLLDSKNNILSNQKITFKVNGNVFTSTTDKNGYAGFLVNLKPGTYNIDYSFAGSNAYMATSGSSIITVAKKATYFRVYSTTTTYDAKNKAQIKLRDQDGNNLAGQNIKVIVNGKTYKFTTNSNGNAYLNAVLKPGSYKTTVKFDGSSSYEASNKTITINVNKAVSNIAAANVKYYYSDTGKKFNVTLKNSNGDPLKNQKIYIVTSKKTFTVKTNSNGIASKSISMPVGKYSINYYYEGSSCYLGSRPAKKATITILKDAIRFQASNYRMNYHNGNYTVKLLSAKGKPMSKEKVTFRLAGKDYVVLTNKTGDATLPIDKSVGTYKIKFSYVNPKDKSQSASDTKTIVIKGIKTILNGTNIYYNYGQNKPLKVTYQTASGKVLPGVEVNFVVDGENYTNTTDSNGIAYLYLNKGVGAYMVQYSVGNHTAYQESSNTSKVVVKGSVFIAKSMTWYTKSYGNYTVRLVDHYGHPIANAIVTFSAVNRTFKRVTDANGYANLAFKLAKGKYKIGFTYDGNSTLPGTSGAKYLTIKDKSVDPSSIKSLARTLTEGLTSDYEKGKVLFNWVRDNIDYSYYANSQQGAAKTLKIRSGNCCDQSNLLVALCREVGVTIRYVHGRAQFLDGTFDHVWTEVKANGKWYEADPVTVRDTFGHNAWVLICIYARYWDLPF